MADFDPSPRSSKRLRTASYQSIGDATISSARPSKLSRVSSTFSSLAKNLFGSTQLEQEIDQDHDSAYASKEDSLNEEQMVLAQDDAGNQPSETPATGRKGTTPSMRRSIRTSAGGEGETSTPNDDQTSQGPASMRGSGRRKKESKSKLQLDVQKEPQLVDNRPAKKGIAKLAKEKAQSEEIQPSQPKLRRRSGQQKATTAHGKVSADAGNPAVSTDDIYDLDIDTEEPTPRPNERSKKRSGQSSKDDAPSEDPRSVKKTRTGHIGISIASPKPKGILTPSSRNRTGPRKSVVFEESQSLTEEQLGFKDIDPSASISKATTSSAHPSATKQKPPTESLPDEDHDLLFDTNPPQDILQHLNLPSSSLLPNTSISDSPSITAIKSHILSRLTSRNPHTTNPIPPQLSTQYHTLHTLLTSTITAGESNSLLLLGSRGCGKSLLIDTALAALSSTHSNDFHVVKLNGFFQTDDKLALREIWRQLGREMAVDEQETGEVMGSYADTMASLLSLLSHVDEMDDVVMDPIVVDGENAAEEGARAAARTSKSVIIILDEFDLFTTHPRQTLLYNLFDIAQSRKAPIAVIGCSTRMDVVECLEKRVKSRFSHRWVHVSGTKSLSAFQDVVEGVLCVGDEEVVEGVLEEDRVKWNEYVKMVFLTGEDVKRLLAEVYHTTKSVPEVLGRLYVSVAMLSLDNAPQVLSSSTTMTKISGASKPKSPTKMKSKGKPSSTPSSSNISAPALTAPSPTSHPSILTLLPTLPTLHLALLIAATRLEALYLAPTINFNAVYAHYMQLHNHTRLKAAASAAARSGTATSVRAWGKEVCRAAWEEIVGWGVCVPVGKEGVGQGGGEGADGAGGGSRWCRVEVTLEEVAWGVKERFGLGGGGGGGGGIGEVLGRWCRDEVVGW